MKTAISAMPALPVAIGVGAGIAMSTALGVPWLAGIAFAVAGIVVGFVWRRRSHASAGALVAAGIGIIIGANSLPRPLPPELENRNVVLTGQVVSVRPTDTSTRLIVELTEGRVDNDSSATLAPEGRILVDWHGSRAEVRPGVTVTVKGRASQLDSVADMPCQPDFNRYLFAEGVASRMTVYSQAGLTVDNPAPGLWDRWSFAARQWWLEAIATAGFDEPATAFMLATLGGENLLLDDDIEARFRDNGLAHLLAISGMHLALVVFVMAAMLGFLRFPAATRRLYYLLLMTAVGGYAVVTGLTPSVCRAALMAIVMLGCGMIETRPNSWQSLSVSVAVVLLVKPLWLYSPGFQLSVAAVAGVITFGRLTDYIPSRHRFWRTAADFVLLPVFALASTMVLTLFYFHSLPLNFWLANIVGAIFVPMLVAVGFVTVLASAAGLPTAIGSWLTDTVYRGMAASVEAVTGPVGEGTAGLFLSGPELALLAGSVIALGWLVIRPGRRVAIAAGVTVAATVAVISLTDRELPEAELYIPRHPRSTDIIVVDNGRAYQWTVSRRNEDEADGDMMFRRYGDFFRNRRTGRPTPLPDPFEGTSVTRHGDVMTVGDKVIGIVRNDTAVPAGHLDYAILAGDYRGVTDTLACRLDADSVIIPRELHQRVAERAERELTAKGFACRRLTVRPLTIVVD